MANSWVVPCNLKVYDVVNHFTNNETIFWKKSSGIRIDDYVYIYIGVPQKAIMYKCLVEDINIDDEEMKHHSYATKGNYGSGCRYMKLHLVSILKAPITLKRIQELGVFMIRKQTRATGELLKMLEIEK